MRKISDFRSKIEAAILRHHYAFVGLSYLVFILGMHRDVVFFLNENVIAGQKVGGFFTWLFWWWHFGLEQGLSLFHSQFLMFPDGVDVFFHSPVNEILALVIQTFSSAYAATNIISLACQILTGLSSYILFFDITRSRWASLCASVPMVFGTYMMTQHAYGQIIEATQYFNPLLLLAIKFRLRRPSNKRTLAVALAFLGVCLSGPYMAYCFVFILFLGAIVFDLVFSNKKIFRIKVTRFDAVVLLSCLLIVALAYVPLLRHAGEWLGGDARIYSSLASFIAVPFWHSSPLMQHLRIGGLGPEDSLGYLGVGTIVFILWGIFKKLHRTNAHFRFWLWILCLCAILSMGPWLSIAPGKNSPIPLPYFLLEQIPLFSSFRTVSRIWVTGTLAASILVAISIQAVISRSSSPIKFSIVASFILLTMFEFDVFQMRHWFVSSRPSQVYVTIKKDPGVFAVLDLPQGYVKGQGFSTSGYFYMLFQPYHQKPLVHGSPSRCLQSSLEFISTTPFVYELTHPWVLSTLMNEDLHKIRRELYIRDGKSILSASNIKYVVFHPYVNAFTPDVQADLENWLDLTLGPPLLVDEKDRRLYKVYD